MDNQYKYNSVLDQLFNNLKIEHLANSTDEYVKTFDDHTINQVVSARALLWLERFCGKDGRVRAFNQIMPKYEGIVNYNVDIEDDNYFNLYYSNSMGFVLKDQLQKSNRNYFSMNFFAPYKQKFEINKIDGSIDIKREGDVELLLKRTKYLNEMRLAA